MLLILDYFIFRKEKINNYTIKLKLILKGSKKAAILELTFKSDLINFL